MRFVTVSTYKSKGFEIFQTSAKYHGIEFDVLGMGKDYVNHTQKSAWLVEYLSGLEKDEVVFFSDSHDAIMLSGEEKIKEKLRNFDHPFIISTEQNLKLEGNRFSKFRTYLALKKGKKPYQFLNSGGWVGKAGYIKEVLEKTLALDVSEQSSLNILFSKNPDLVKLDNTHEIFTCTAGRRGLEEEDYTTEGDRVKNNITNTYPAVIHFPGKNFTGANRITKKLSFLGNHTYDESKTSRYSWDKFKNKLTDRTLQDNYLFHFIIHGLLVLLFLIVLLIALQNLV